MKNDAVLASPHNFTRFEVFLTLIYSFRTNDMANIGPMHYI